MTATWKTKLKTEIKWSVGGKKSCQFGPLASVGTLQTRHLEGVRIPQCTVGVWRAVFPSKGRFLLHVLELQQSLSLMKLMLNVCIFQMSEDSYIPFCRKRQYLDQLFLKRFKTFEKKNKLNLKTV